MMATRIRWCRTHGSTMVPVPDPSCVKVDMVAVATDLDGVDWFAAIAAMIRPGGSKREIAERTIRAALGLEEQA